MAHHAERQAARHAAPRISSASRVLLRAGLTVSVAGAALGFGGAPAGAAPGAAPAAPAGDVGAPTAGREVTDGLARAAVGVLAPARDLRPNPLAGTGTDPLDNSVGTQVADFKPVSTAVVTEPLAGGASVAELPGAVTRALRG